MAILKVLVYPHPFLRTNAVPVSTFDDTIKQLAEDMIETMYISNGIGLAATQVGENKRLFVIDVRYKPDNPESQPQAIVVINPEIVKSGGETTFEEGCLSIPEVRADVKRFETLTLKFHDMEAQERHMDAEGLEAICIQHELDHLNGKLFVDYLPLMKRKMIQAKLKKMAR